MNETISENENISESEEISPVNRLNFFLSIFSATILLNIFLSLESKYSDSVVVSYIALIIFWQYDFKIIRQRLYDIGVKKYSRWGIYLSIIPNSILAVIFISIDLSDGLKKIAGALGSSSNVVLLLLMVSAFIILRNITLSCIPKNWAKEHQEKLNFEKEIKTLQNEKVKLNQINEIESLKKEISTLKKQISK